MSGIHGCGLHGKPKRSERNVPSQSLKVQAPDVDPYRHSCDRQQASKQPLQVCSMAGAAVGRAAKATAAIQAMRGSGRCGGMDCFACVLSRLLRGSFGCTLLKSIPDHRRSS